MNPEPLSESTPKENIGLKWVARNSFTEMAKAERTAALKNAAPLFTAEAQRTQRERREGIRRRFPPPLCEVSAVSAHIEYAR